MKLKNAMLATLIALGSAPMAWADHNSPFGEGWANMPNDIHDSRIDSLEDGETGAFMGGAEDTLQVLTVENSEAFLAAKAAATEAATTDEVKTERQDRLMTQDRLQTRERLRERIHADAQETAAQQRQERHEYRHMMREQLREDAVASSEESRDTVAAVRSELTETVAEMRGENGRMGR